MVAEIFHHVVLEQFYVLFLCYPTNIYLATPEMAQTVAFALTSKSERPVTVRV